MYLPVTVFPEVIQTPVACKKLLYTCQYSIPSSPDVSRASFEEENHEEASSHTTSSSEWYENPLIFTVRQEINKRDREAPKQAWSSLVLEKPMTEMPIPSYSAYPLRLEAAGTQLIRHVRLQNQPSRNSKINPVPPGKFHEFFFSLFSWPYFIFHISIISKIIDSMVGSILEDSVRSILDSPSWKSTCC